MMGVPTHRSRRFCLAALGIVLLTIVVRLPSLVHPQPIDSEAMYSVVANEIVDGGRPYIDAVERKPPLLFWTYAAIFNVAGKFNWKALHIVVRFEKRKRPLRVSAARLSQKTATPTSNDGRGWPYERTQARSLLTAIDATCRRRFVHHDLAKAGTLRF